MHSLPKNENHLNHPHVVPNLCGFLSWTPKDFKRYGCFTKQTMHHKSVHETQGQHSKPSEAFCEEEANILFMKSSPRLKLSNLSSNAMSGLCTTFDIIGIRELYTSQAEIWEPWSRRCSANILVWLLKHQKTWNILHTYWLIVVLSSVGFFSRFWSSDTRRSAMCLVLCSREESYKDNNMMTIFTFVRTYFKVVNFNQWDLGRRSLNNLFIMSLCYFRLIL